jgi:hypothetical protein
VQVINEQAVIVAVLPSEKDRQNMEIAQYLKALDDDIATELTVTQYISPREHIEVNEATVDLDSFVLDFFKDEPESMPLVNWSDIELKSENDDSQPIKIKATRVKKPKLLHPKIVEPTVVTLETPTIEVYALLDALQEQLADNVKDAELYCPINVELFASVQKIKAEIDWLDLRFTVDPIVCKFYKAPDARSRIKEFITKRTGTRYYIASDDSHIIQDGASFTIRLHDVRNEKDIKAITNLLAERYGAQREAMTIEAIELSLDFYGGDSSAMVIKLHKAMRYPIDAKLLRIYKTKWTLQDIPTSPHALYEFIKNGYNIGMGDHRSDEFCVRVYFKRTDKGGQPLSTKEYRARIEVTLRKSAFSVDKIGLHLDNLSKIIICGFKKMQFTHLSKRATFAEKDEYFTQVKPFGKEQADTLSISRNKRNLPDAIASFAWLNEVKRNAVKDLAEKF